MRSPTVFVVAWVLAASCQTARNNGAQAVCSTHSCWMEVGYQAESRLRADEVRLAASTLRIQADWSVALQALEAYRKACDLGPTTECLYRAAIVSLQGQLPATTPVRSRLCAMHATLPVAGSPLAGSLAGGSEALSVGCRSSEDRLRSGSCVPTGVGRTMLHGMTATIDATIGRSVSWAPSGTPRPPRKCSACRRGRRRGQ